MSNLFDLLVAGLATGAIYALVAVGFTLLWQTSQTINFAQGEFVMLPAFLMLAAMHVGAPFWLAIILGILLSMILLGLAFKMLLVDPMMRHGVLPLAIATMALAIGIKEAVKQFFSAEASPFPSIVPTGDISVLGHTVSLQSIGVLLVAIVAVVGLTTLLNRTSLGHGTEPDRRAHHRRARRTDDFADLPDQCFPGGSGVAADHADLSGKILLR
jgi:branched-chain amino acid transport system permease protein